MSEPLEVVDIPRYVVSVCHGRVLTANQASNHTTMHTFQDIGGGIHDWKSHPF